MKMFSKKIKVALFASIFIMAIAMPFFVFARVESVDRGYTENIKKYDITIDLNKDGRAHIRESLMYDFGINQKHGIYRFIPNYYKNRFGNPHQKISNITVSDEKGKPIPFISEDGFNVVNIIIGDENKLVTGVVDYVIQYDVSNTISSENSSDYFNWDVIGGYWDVPISNISVNLNLPDYFKNKKISYQCFVGNYGSSNICNNLAETNSFITLFQPKIYPKQYLTLNVSFPKGYFSEPSLFEKIFWESRWYAAMPLVTLLIFFIFWLKKGRDPKGRGTIVVQYSPPKDLNPMEAELILKNKNTSNSFSALIIYFAQKGYITIKELAEKKIIGTKIEYELLNNNKNIDSLGEADSFLFLYLIGTAKTVNLSKDKNILDLYNGLKSSVARHVIKKGYLKNKPSVVTGLWFGVTAAVFVVFLIVAIYLNIDIIGVILIFWAMPLFVIFSIIMPARTKSGVVVFEYMLGLREYIKHAEIERIKFSNPAKEIPQKFEELLPFAMIFGLEKQWAKKFEKFYTKQPDWYKGSLTTFSMVHLSKNLSVFSDNITSAITAAAAASVASEVASGVGGGFAGGGGGGGGGGSW